MKNAPISPKRWSAPTFASGNGYPDAVHLQSNIRKIEIDSRGAERTADMKLNQL